MVDELIDKDTRRWDLEALKEIFVSSDVELIKASQPSIFHQDSFSWKFNRSGNLTVKSAYWLAMDHKIKAHYPETLISPSLNVIKARIWKIPTVPKIRVFLWKVLSEAFPVADSIIKRGMKVDTRC